MIKKLLLIFLILLLTVGGYIFTKKPQFEIRIKAEQIQAQLEKAFPYEKKHLLVLKTVFTNPRVDLQDNSDKIGIAFDVSVVIAGVESLKNNLYVQTGVRYDADSGSLFLWNPKLKKFQIQGIPGNTERVVRDIVGQAVMDIFADRPVYRFKDVSRAQKVAKALVKKIEVRGGRLVVTFGL